MKKIIPIIIVASLLLTACGTNANTNRRQRVENPTGANMEIQIEHSWAGSLLHFEDAIVPEKLFQAGDWLILRYYQEYSGYGAIYNLETGEYQKPADKGFPIGAEEDGDSIQVLWKNIDSDHNITYTAATYDSDMQEIASETIAFPEMEVVGWLPLEEGQLIYNYEGLYYVTDEGKERISGVSSGISGIFRNPDGRIFVTSNMGNELLAEFFPDRLECEMISIPDMPPYCIGYASGNESYDWFCWDDTTLYGVKGQTLETVIDWDNSDLTGLNVRDAVCLPDGEFVVSQGDFALTYKDLYCLRERTQEELDSMETITLAIYQMDNYLQEMIHRWNRQTGHSRIAVKTYIGTVNVTAEEWVTSQKAFSEFQNDMVNGIIPDIVCVNNAEYEMLSNKGLFEDLRPWMEDDPDFHEADYLMNFFDSMEYAGAMERIAFSYYIYLIAAKSEFVGTENFHQAADYLRIAETMPEDMTLFSEQNGRDYILQWLVCNLAESYIDYAKGECSFDSEEFVQLLELCALASQTPSQYPDDYAWRKDTALLYTAVLNRLENYHEIKAMYFDNAPVTLLGLPQGEKNGNGGVFEPWSTLAVTANSLHKEEIWEFIKFCLQEENQSCSSRLGGALPVNRAALQNLFALEQEEQDGIIYQHRLGGQVVDIGLPTTEEAAELTAFIEGITVSTSYNETLQPIITEEAGMFFAGDCTAQEAADKIQSRVSLYLAEIQ